MRFSQIQLSTLAGLALACLYACTDKSGLSFLQDGSAPSADGASTATGGITSGTGGTKGGFGGAIAPTGGTKGGFGGATSATGGSGSGGQNTGTGGIITGTGGSAIDGGASKDAFQCGPICDIYCPFGNEIDNNGCLTCSCKPDPKIDAGMDAKPTDTKPIVCPMIACIDIVCEGGYLKDSNGCPTCTCNTGPVVCPALKCKSCVFGNVKDSSGCDTCTCAADPSAACASLTGEYACAAAGTRCKWLTQGCGTPALSATGCYDQKLLNCTTSCPDGLTCLKRSINPCANVNCTACGQEIGICL